MSSYMQFAQSTAGVRRVAMVAAAALLVAVCSFWAPTVGYAAHEDPVYGGTAQPIRPSVSSRGGNASALPTALTPAPSPQFAPLPALPPGTTAHVGIQAGHWKSEELPDELASLRESTGAKGKGWNEVDVNLDLATRVAALLTQAGVQVDLLPSTIPVDYKADAFVAIHADANNDTALSGFKAARAVWSSIPEKDDALVTSLKGEYQSATGLPEHPQTITQNMLQYYAFNHHLAHSVDPATPAAILETGFLTNAGDRALLTEQPDRAAQGIARGILMFLTSGK